MGKQKNIEIKNLFFKDLDGQFKSGITDVAKTLKLSKKKLTEKGHSKMAEVRSFYEDQRCVVSKYGSFHPRANKVLIFFC